MATSAHASLAQSEAHEDDGASCNQILPGSRGDKNSAITTEDLVALRDFGGAGLDPSAAPGFAVSPDQKRIVLQVRQAEPETNSYCMALLIYRNDVSALARPMVVSGGSIVRDTFTLDGLAGFPSGTARPLTPSWSPDGRWIAYLRRDRNIAQLWIAAADGSDAHALTEGSADVGEFHWLDDGHSIAFGSEDDLHSAQMAIAAEGSGGYRYDDRFWTLATTNPFPRGTFELSWYRVDIRSDLVRRMAVTDSQPANLGDGNGVSVVTDALPRFAYHTRLDAHIDGRRFSCTLAPCKDLSAAWWNVGTRSAIFAKREGYAFSKTALYRWDPASNALAKIYISSDALTGCASSGRTLICGRESSTQPRDIVAIDVVTGAKRPIVNPNPEWETKSLPRVRRLHWVNRFGLEAIGDLVDAPTPLRGKPHPLVVVQYETRGFLRGGTGDEYPIFPLVSAGFDVLSVSRPVDYNFALARAGKPVNQRVLVSNWVDRQSTHDSILAGVKAAERLSPIDKRHVAITGLSDGASAAEYALIHSKVFSLALLSTCCDDPIATTTQIGSAYNSMLRDYDYPLPWERYQRSWKQMSLAMNAGTICARIQIQAADRESRMALDSYERIKDSGLPISLYIYPNEYHVKWQPAHREAVYRRNLAALASWVSDPPLHCAV